MITAEKKISENLCNLFRTFQSAKVVMTTSTNMEYLTYGALAIAGFMWGRVYELNFGYFKKRYKEAMAGWHTTCDLLRKAQDHQATISPFQVHGKDTN